MTFLSLVCFLIGIVGLVGAYYFGNERMLWVAVVTVMASYALLEVTKGKKP